MRVPACIATTLLLTVTASGCLAQTPLPGPGWPHWRGPERSGVTLHTSGWDQGAWPPGQPLWTRPVGRGGTSPLVVNGRVYVMGWAGGRDTVRALDATSGDVLWERSYPCPEHGRHHAGDENMYGGPSATPEHDPQTGYLYTLSIDGDLNCWDARDTGRQVWGRNLYDAHGTPRRPDAGGGARDYGYTTAPLVHGPWLIVQVGCAEGNLIAYDKMTGRPLWASECTDPAGHTGGLVPMTVGGVPCVGVLTLRRFVVARLDEGQVGRTAASYDWQTHFANSIATPAVAGDSVILSSGYNMNRTERVRISLSGAERVWRLLGRWTGVCSPVVGAGHIYWAGRQVVCVDLHTGKVRWEGGSFGADASCLLTGDGRLLVFASKRLLLVEGAGHSPDAYRELARVDGPGGKYSWPHLVLAAGKILAKDLDGNLICRQLSAR